MAEQFNLTELVRKVMDETDIADPGALAAKVAEQIPARQRVAALHQALPNFVRVTIGRSRGPHAHTNNGHGPAGGPAGRTQAARSAKVTAIRNAAPVWKRALRERIHVGNRRWAMVGKCSYEELMYAVTERRRIAAQIGDSADRYEKVALALVEYGVETPEQLPESVLADLFPSNDDEEEAA